MKHIAAFTAVCAAAALLAAAASAAPRLRVAGASPVVVEGSGFFPREHVTVTTPSLARRVLVRADGSFTLSLAGRVADRCSTGMVSAVGAKGDRAVRHLPKPLCAPAGAP